MLAHFRRILLVVAIFIVAGWSYKQWREKQEGYGLFDLLQGKKSEDVNAFTPSEGSKLSEDDMPELAKFSRESAKLAATVLPSVVSINTESKVPVRPRNIREYLQGYGVTLQSGLGSGVIVSNEGHIVTNLHVVKGAAQILVTTNDQLTARAEIVGVDSQLDIAVLKMVGSRKDFPALSFGDSENAQVGQVVFAVGNPFGLSGTVTQGIISATKRLINETAADYLQTDTVINPGNSGGPLVNILGEVIGINVSLYAGDEKVHAWQGIGLAIPANDVKASLDRLMTQKPPQVGYLGITLRRETVTVTSNYQDTLGVVVDSVQPNSPAQTAGLQAGDVIIAIDGRTLDSPEHVFLTSRDTPPGEQMNFTILREGQTLNLDATIQALPGI